MEKKHSRALTAPCASMEPLVPELRKILLRLLKLHFVLNLIHEQGTVVLPQNWQN